MLGGFFTTGPAGNTNVASTCCCCSVAKSCPTLCNRMDCYTPSFPVLHCLPQFAQIHVESVMPSNHLILCRPLLLPPSIFPSFRVFSNESALHIRCPKTEASASVLPVNIQGWFPLGLTGLISLLSRESSPASQFESINSSALSLLYTPTLTFICDYWKNHRFDYMHLCRQSNVSAF